MMDLLHGKRKPSPCFCLAGVVIYLGLLTLANADILDYMYVSNGSNILRMSMKNDSLQLEESVYHQGGRIVGLALDVEEDLLFWSDLGRTHNAIYSSRLDGTKVNIIVKDVSDCNGMSVDWVSKHLYWTDAGQRTMEVANYDGSGRRILVASGLINPRGIVVDPVFGFVYFADQGTRTIERTWLDGSERRVLVDKDLAWPNQMAFSYSTRRVYWVDSKRQVIMSCDKDGDEITVERRVQEATQGNPVFGLVVIGKKAFISQWFAPKISSTYVAISNSKWKLEMTMPLTTSSNTQLYSLVTTWSTLQTGSYHPCGNPDKGDCSHLCLPTRGTSYKCACPSYGGLALSFNAKSCEAPSELLFFTLRDSGEVGFISLRGAQSVYLALAGRSRQPSAVTYDPIKQVVYWSDVEEHAIFYASLAGTGNLEVFLNASDGLGEVEAMALDWRSGQLYFTNTGIFNVGLDGAVYPWHRLERISLDKTDRQTVVSDLDQPRGIALDTEKGLLYYADWSKRPRVVRSFLDGSNRTVLLDHNLQNPKGLSFYRGRLYVVDAIYGNQTGPPHLMVYDEMTSDWTQLKLSSNISQPQGLAVQGDTLYYCDWVSDNSPVGYVKSYNLRFGVDNNVIFKGKRPSGLHYSPLARRREDSTNNLCQKSQCSHSCIRLPLSSPSERKIKCACPDQSGLVLSKNNNTCIRPKNFLLVPDLNTIRLLSLDDHTQREAQVLHYSDSNSNFVALAYNDMTDTIFWSDLTTKSIYSSSYMDFKPQRVFIANYYIDGIAVDRERNRLFWTGYNSNGTGLIARMHLERMRPSYHIILDGLSNPRAVHLYLERKLIFWTEYGGKTPSASVKRAKANGRNPRKLLSKGLFWPNALATFNERLYVADGAGKVFVMDFMGKNLEEVRSMGSSTKQFYGLAVMETVMFYSDWLSNRPSVVMVDRLTGKKETVVSGLSRPTSIVIHHPTNLTVENQCLSKEKKCAETCIPVPKSYHCTCSVGSKLAADGFNCIKMASPWEVTDESKCMNGCHVNAYCSQLVPLTKYECVCKDGYEGDGFHCQECAVDFYKSLLGNDTCYPCPINSTTNGALGASQCFCKNPLLLLVNRLCTEITTTASTSSMTMIENDTREFEGTLTTDNPGWTTDGHINGDRLPGSTAGQPFYENCPHGETKRIRLRGPDRHAFIPVVWTARDSYGNPLKSISDFEQEDNSIKVSWVANGDAGLQTVEFEATDQWMQTTTCQFRVLLEDFVKPRFTMCPDNIIKSTSVNREPIDWPPPIAIDNVNPPTVTTTHERKSEFSIGTTLVQYTATDNAGNTASCVFNVTLVDEHPCNVTEMRNGGFVCSTSEKGNCEIVCDREYVLNPLNVFPKSFNCADENSIAALKKGIMKWEPCLRKKRPTTARQEFSLTFQGDCRPHDQELKRELRSKVINKLEEKQLCTGAVCSHSPITILCNPPQPKRRRYAEDKFNMAWNVTIEYIEGLSPGQVFQIVNDLKFELRKLIAHLTFFLKQHQYKLLPGSVNTMEFEWLCSSGEMVTKDGCVACPPGTYLNVSRDTCVLCEPGMYQNASSQEVCLACPVGFTLEKGAITINDCKDYPAINKMTKFFIIVACSVAIVFLCIVLLLYLQYSYHKRKAKNASTSSSNNSKYSNPNVYAQAPAMKQKCPDYIRNSNREFFMSSHDYEDIDNHNNSTFETFSRHPPGCRDSLCSFKAHTDMTFLPSPRDSNGPSPFLYSDDVGLPRSPRESAKCLNIHGDAYPYGTLGSFKGSPPPSPYRSLHLSANGPIPKGNPESPSHNSQMLNSLLGDESPYTSRLIRDRLIDPDSPYRIISQDRRTPVPESPYKITRRLDSDSPYHTGSDIGMESPYRSPAFQRHISSGSRTAPEMHHGRSPGLVYVTDSQHSLRSVPESPQFHHKILPSNEEPSAFVPVGDFLYKRPPSPLSPPTSSRKSNDSLPRSPSTPRASPGMSRKRMDKSQRTPPQKRKVRNEYGLYEYE